MDSLLQEINMLPGVLGCFVYGKNQQIIGSKMPPVFKEHAIQTIGNLLARTIQMGNMIQMRFADIEIKYNESLLVINPLANGSLLVSICAPTTNKSLVSMTTGMLAKDIQTFMVKGGTPVSRVPPSVPPQPSTPSGDSQSVAMQQSAPPPSHPKEAEIGADLAPILEKVKDALALSIGPIAAPVMKDTIETWAQESTPSINNLQILARLLCDEINDTALEKEFMTELNTILR